MDCRSGARDVPKSHEAENRELRKKLVEALRQGPGLPCVSVSLRLCMDARVVM